METVKTRVFISFHHGEEGLAGLIKRALEQQDVGPIYKADDALYAGSEWLNEIRRKLHECDLFIVICSPSSIQRNWLAFECGAAIQNNKCTLIAFCHSGLTVENLELFFNSIGADGSKYSVVDAASKSPIQQLVESTQKILKTKVENVAETRGKYEEKELDLRKALAKGYPFRVRGMDEALAKTNKSEKVQSYHLCTVSWIGEGPKASGLDGNPSLLEIDIPPENVTGAIDQAAYKSMIHPEKNYDPGTFNNFEQDRLRLLGEMSQLISGDSEFDLKTSIQTGIALGVQNCLFNSNTNELFVGVRFKSNVDATSSGICLSKGEFNTGYQLIRNGGDHRESAKTIDTLHDLFNSSTTLKHLVMPLQSKYKDENMGSREQITGRVFDAINSRLKLFGTRLFKLKLQKKYDGSQEYVYASLFINNSCWFPRFEIGVWKYMDISSFEDDQLNNEKHFVDGFGEDVFQDYRGTVEDPASEINFWVWVKDGEIKYRSYPEERYIPRNKPQRRMRPQCHSILVSSDQLSSQYEINNRFTQFVPDETLSRLEFDQIMHTRAGQPATRLLTWF